MFYSDIVIIDSGVSVNNTIDISNINGVRISYNNNDFVTDCDYEDQYGHGTAITNIIVNLAKNVKVFAIKIFEDENSIDEDILIYALKYVNENIDCRLVNLSMGLKVCEKKEELKSVCDELVKKNIIIVSAFDNDDCMSWPASFDNIIGVCSSYRCKNALQFEYVENSPINILAKGGIQRIQWGNKTTVLGGSSFACAHISAYLINAINNIGVMSFIELLGLLKENASYVHKCMVTKRNKNSYFKINNAVIFPINKEMHSLIRYSDNLECNIKSVYDIKQSGRVGAQLNKIIDNIHTSISNFIIEDINRIRYENIDTLIVGHMSEVNRILGYDVRLSVIKEAVKNNINIFSFDSLEYCYNDVNINNVKIYYPEITHDDIPQNTYGKLYLIDKPVISIFGTSSKQGKFTLQIKLKELFESKMYKVGLLGTEPHSLLFGADCVYPMGYNSSISVDPYSSVLILNNMLNDISSKGVEVIITGSQSRSIPSNNYNAREYPLKQHTYLMGIQPDIIVLCVNPDDHIEYIKNSIKYLEGAVNSYVCAIVVFPMIAKDDWYNMYEIKRKLNNDEIVQIKENFKQSIHKPTFCLDNSEDIEKLVETIIDYFAG